MYIDPYSNVIYIIQFLVISNGRIQQVNKNLELDAIIHVTLQNII